MSSWKNSTEARPASTSRECTRDEERMMVFCVVGKKQIPQLKQIVGTIDPDAFVVVSDAREVLGEGFQTDFS